EPDPQGQYVVLLERAREERAVRAAPDVAVDALVELDQQVVVVARLRELPQERDGGRAIARRAPLGREPRSMGLEREPHLRKAREVAHVDRRYVDPPTRQHLDEPVARERTQ